MRIDNASVLFVAPVVTTSQSPGANPVAGSLEIEEVNGSAGRHVLQACRLEFSTPAAWSCAEAIYSTPDAR